MSSSGRSQRWTWAEVLVIGELMVLLTAALLPAAGAGREQGARVRCASNLRQIGQAMMMYANSEVRNGQSYPRTKYDPAKADQPTAFTNWKQPHSFGDGAPEANDLTAPVYLLFKTQELPPLALHCPDSKAKVMVFEDSPAELRRGPDGKLRPVLAKSPADLSNFPGIEYMSYSFQNPYGGNDALMSGFKWNVTLSQDFALAADINPGGDAVLKAKPSWSKKQMHDANSPNHGGEGQNVLYGDGHVDWQPSPFCGSMRGPANHQYGDNIYAPEKATKTVMAPPQDNLDNVLLPAAGYKAPGK